MLHLVSICFFLFVQIIIQNVLHTHPRNEKKKKKIIKRKRKKMKWNANWGWLCDVSWWYDACNGLNIVFAWCFSFFSHLFLAASHSHLSIYIYFAHFILKYNSFEMRVYAIRYMYGWWFISLFSALFFWYVDDYFLLFFISFSPSILLYSTLQWLCIWLYVHFKSTTIIMVACVSFALFFGHAELYVAYTVDYITFAYT